LSPCFGIISKVIPSLYQKDRYAGGFCVCTIIKEIAQKIVREQFLQNWHFYAIFILFSLLVAVASAYLTSYMRERGKNFASKADFDNLISQLKVTTKTAEEVRTSISHADWTAKELKTLRRIKLEELLESVYLLRRWMDKYQNERFFGNQANDEICPIVKISLISRLYFPEFKLEMLKLNQFSLEYMGWTSGIAIELRGTEGDSVTNSAVWEKLKLEVSVYSSKLQECISQFEEKAPMVMNGIVAV